MTTWKEKPPEVTLLTGPEDPLGVMYEVWQRSRGFKVEPKDSPRRRKDEVDMFHRLIFDYTQIPEIIEFGWWLQGVPRAFFDQAVRHRKTSMFARSQRVMPALNFYRDGEYLTTTPIAENLEARTIYSNAMKVCEEAFHKLVNNLDIPVEDARGILPLHLRTGFMWGLSLRDMVEVFRTRTCHVLQQEYWGPIIWQMKEAVEKIDLELGIIFKPPCLRPENKCVSELEAKIRVVETLKGVRTDLRPCRLWIEKYEVSWKASDVLSLVNDGTIKWAQAPEDFKP